MIEELFLALLLTILLSLILLSFRVRAGKSRRVRPLRGAEELPGLVAQAAEMGRPLHVSVGVGGVGGPTTAETWAGLTLLGQVADGAAACGFPLIVTVADATVLPIAQDILQRAYVRHDHPEDYDPAQVRLVAPDPTAYAVGTMGLIERDPLAGNVMIGSFGDEYLLIGETGVRRGVHQVVGAADPRVLPFVYGSADATLMGEEMFAGGAYTSRLPLQIASLLTEDWMRWVVIAAMVIVALWKVVA